MASARSRLSCLLSPPSRHATAGTLSLAARKLNGLTSETSFNFPTQLRHRYRGRECPTTLHLASATRAGSFAPSRSRLLLSSTLSSEHSRFDVVGPVTLGLSRLHAAHAYQNPIWPLAYVTLGHARPLATHCFGATVGLLLGSIPQERRGKHYTTFHRSCYVQRPTTSNFGENTLPPPPAATH